MSISNFISKLFNPSKDAEGDTATAANHWDKVQSERKALDYKYFDWGDHPTLTQLVYGELFDSKKQGILDYLVENYPEFSSKKALSLCCGPGTFERTLVESNVFADVAGLDVAPGLIADANAARHPFEDRLSFKLGDVNLGDFGQNNFDIVFAKAALHHVERLEPFMEGIRNCLKSGGHLITIDYFGPSRFQWTDVQLEVSSKFVEDSIPLALRRRADKAIYSVTRPTVDEMIKIDPSEAARSDELEGSIKDNFKNINSFDLGGTLLNLIFDSSIINNFDEHNDSHNNILEKAFRLERKLIASGKLRSDFKFLIAEIDK